MRSILLVLLFLLFSSSCFALDISIEDQVQGLLNKKKYDEAYSLLVKHNQVDSKDPQEWFLLGISAKMSGRSQEALQDFEKVVELDPASPRIKLEIASICYNNGSYDRAKALLLEVKSQNPPSNVVQNIDRFLALVEREKKQNKPYRFQVSTGLVYDSNVNAGPLSDTVTILGLPFSLDDTAKPKEDTAYLLDIGFGSAIKVSPKINWQSNISISRRDYFQEKTYDTQLLQGTTGAVLRLGNRMILSLPLLADMTWYGSNEGYYLTDVGIIPQMQYALSKTSKLNISFGVYNRDYKNDDNRDTRIYSFSPAFDVDIKNRLSIQSVINLGMENARNDIYSNKSFELNEVAYYSIKNDMLVKLFCGYGQSFYEEQQAIYSDKRTDLWWKLGVDLRYNYSQFDSDIVLAASYVRNTSRLELYDYERTSVSLRLSKYF